MKYKIILPVIFEDITNKCIASISEKHKQHIIIVDNSSSGFSKKYGLETYFFPENIGVARAWNIGARRVIKGKLDYLIICSSSMVFNKGMDDLVAQLEINQYKYGLNTLDGWHLIAIGRSTFDKIGLFDENFYPAYYEDTDFVRRMELAKIHQPNDSITMPFLEVDCYSQGTAISLDSGVKINLQACKEYFIKKWGGDMYYENNEARNHLFTSPFNSGLGLNFWEPKTIEHLKSEYKL